MYNVRRAASSCFCIKVDIVELRAVLLSSCLGFGLGSRGVHGNGEDWDPMGPMGFPLEWE